MMDRLIDTSEKRRMAFACMALLMMIALLLPYLLLSVRLLTMRDYDDVFTLLKDPIVTKTYVSRIVLLCIRQGNMDVLDLLKICMQALDFKELSLFFVWMIWCCHRERKRVRRIFFIQVIMLTAVLGGLAHVAFSSLTLMEAVRMMRWMGLCLCCASFLQLLMHGYLLGFVYAKKYGKALRVEVMEMDEEALQAFIANRQEGKTICSKEEKETGSVR